MNRSVVISLSALLVLVAGIALTAFFGIERWEKVIEEGKPGTFSVKEEPTDEWQVTLMDHDLCYVGQDWQECIRRMNTEYASACNESLDFTEESVELCSAYRQAIDDMLEEPNGDKLEVAEVRSIQKGPRQEQYVKKTKVPNRDEKPAKTQPAYCLFGVSLECPTLA